MLSGNELPLPVLVSNCPHDKKPLFIISLTTAGRSENVHGKEKHYLLLIIPWLMLLLLFSESDGINERTLLLFDPYLKSHISPGGLGDFYILCIV